MTPPVFTFVTCPACRGAGCPACGNNGGWLESENGQKLNFTNPGSVRAANLAWQPFLYMAGTTLGAAGLILCLGLLTTLAWPNLGETLWLRHPASLGFGISSVLFIASVTARHRLRRSAHSFHDLAERLASHPPDQVIDLADYANSRVINLLNEAAGSTASRGGQAVEDADLFQALLRNGRTQVLIARLEVNPHELTDGQSAFPTTTGRYPVAASALKRLLHASSSALAQNFPYLDLEDVLLSYTLPDIQDNQPYTTFLEGHHITGQNLLAVARWYAEDEERSRLWTLWQDRGRSRPKNSMNRSWTALPTPFLDSYSTDLTLAASYGRIDNLAIYETELDAILETLATGTSHPLLVGEPGSGTDDVLTTLATHMITGQVPPSLQDKRLVSLDLTRLLTADHDREAAVQHVLSEIQRAGNVILAIPEVQSLADATNANLDGSQTLANALKNKALQIVATASYADYHRYVEQNSLLKSQLRLIELHSLTHEETVRYLETQTARLEAKFKTIITYPALEEAAKLAERLIPEPVAPANAVQLLEKACTVPDTSGWVRKTVVQKAAEQLTDVPVSTAAGEEAQNLLNLEQTLHKRVIGQDQAVTAVAEALRRARAGLTNGNRPLGSFLFVGPTGVGKTELAKALCEAYFGPEHEMIRFDMSEFQEPRAIYTLIGAPLEDGKGGEGGLLTKAVREHPFSLILFDELEKAHPDVLNLFLQILDDGRLTENTGRTIRFHTCIIIATSNAQSQAIGQLLDSGSSVEQLQPSILRLLEQNYRPEFLNRFDGVIPFRPLSQEQLAQIASLMVESVAIKARQQDVGLTVAPEALAKLVAAGYDPAYGARPLRRTIEQKLEGILADALLRGTIKPGDTLHITGEMIH